ncbi:MAG: ParB/RepB/Spo0J family partition protein [Acidimicrobiales bacterium]
MTTTEAATEVPERYVLRMVDPKSIVDNPDNARKPKANREGLAGSIKALGILSPPLVWELADGTLRLIAGERRKYSAIAAGLVAVPVYVRNERSPVQQVAGMLVENMDRESLSTVEEACAIQQLADFDGMSTKAITASTG